MASRPTVHGVVDSYQYSSLSARYGDALGDQDNDMKQAPTVRHGDTRRLRFLAVFPALVSAIAAAGMATGLVAYLFIRRITPGILDDATMFHGAIVVREATLFNTLSAVTSIIGEDQSANGTSGETKLYGLFISSLSKDVVSWSVPFVVAVYGFILANVWIKSQRRQVMGSLPTPTQYGLLLSLLNGTGIMDVFATFSYLAHDRRSRPTSPNLLHGAVYFVSFVLLIGFGLTAADLWLHTAKAVIYTSITPVPASELPLVGSQIDLDVCPGPLGPLPDGLYRNCLVNWGYRNDAGVLSGLVWGNSSLRAEGSAVVASNSAISRVSFADDDPDLSVLIPATLPLGLDTLRFSTVGMRTSCASTQTCVIEPQPDPQINCPSFAPPLVKNWATPASNVYVQSTHQLNATVSVFQYNSTNNMIPPSNSQGDPDTSASPIPGSYDLGSSLNPAGAILFLSWVRQNVNGLGITFPDPATLPPGWYSTEYNDDKRSQIYYYIGTCNISVYDVNVTYSNTASTQLRVTGKPVETDFNASAALLSALDPEYAPNLARYMLSSLEASLDVPSDVFQGYVARNMSFAALGLVSGIMQRTPALSATNATQSAVGRYPLAPLCTLLALLYLHSLICLAVFVVATFLSSPEVVLDADTRTSHTLLDLAQLRLTSPRAVVADAFDTRAARDVLADKSLGALYEEQREANPARLGVGLVSERVDATGAGKPGSGQVVQRLRVSGVDKLEQM